MDAGPRAEGTPRPGTRGLQCAHRLRLLGARPQAGLEAPEGKDVEAPVSLRARPRPGVRPPGPGWHADLPPHGPAGSRRKRAPWREITACDTAARFHKGSREPLPFQTCDFAVNVATDVFIGRSLRPSAGVVSRRTLLPRSQGQARKRPPKHGRAPLPTPSAASAPPSKPRSQTRAPPAALGSPGAGARATRRPLWAFDPTRTGRPAPLASGGAQAPPGQSAAFPPSLTTLEMRCWPTAPARAPRVRMAGGVGSWPAGPPQPRLLGPGPGAPRRPGRPPPPPRTGGWSRSAGRFSAQSLL